MFFLARIALAGLFCLSFSANSFAKDDEWPRCRGAKADPQDSVVAADPPKVLSPGQVSAEFTCSWACSAVAKCRLCEPKTPSSDQRTSPSSQDHLAAQLTLRSLYVFALGIPFPSSGDRRQQCRCTRPSSGKAGVSPAFFSERTFLVSSLKDLFGVNAAHIIALKLNTALQLDGLRPFDLIPNCPMRPSAAVRRRCCASDPWRASSSVRSNLDFGSDRGDKSFSTKGARQQRFNPRPHERGDQGIGALPMPPGLVSIHAPARGAPPSITDCVNEGNPPGAANLSAQGSGTESVRWSH